jgi:hypothetical protein
MTSESERRYESMILLGIGSSNQNQHTHERGVDMEACHSGNGPCKR